MSFIDWSDPDVMFALLLEYVQDALSECHGDAPRRRFLSDLVEDLSALEARFPSLPDGERAGALRELIVSADSELERDPVVEHLEHCAQELDRIRGQRAAR